MKNKNGMPAVIIIRGEGEIGTIEAHTGKDTLRAIEMRLTRERCGGDRWARAYRYQGESKYDDGDYIYVNTDGTGDVRMITVGDINA